VIYVVIYIVIYNAQGDLEAPASDVVIAVAAGLPVADRGLNALLIGAKSPGYLGYPRKQAWMPSPGPYMFAVGCSRKVSQTV
jgi:hypothetical protein